MSQTRDPIDNWLSADVQPLRPPPGAFDRIHRTARRRKAVRAATALTGVAIVVAGAVTLPQVAAGLLPGRGGPAKIAGKSTSPGASRTGSQAPVPSTSPSVPGSQPGASALGSTGGTHQAAPGFMPTSVTFVGSAGGVVGAVLGRARCPSGPCTSVAGTPDYGRHWFKVGAPPAGPPNGASGVSQIRFSDTSNGWAYGPELFATHDGGLAWKKVALPGRVTDLSAIGGRAFAVLAQGCGGAGSDYARNCASITLLSTPVQSDRWRPVRGAATGIGEAPGGLQLTSQYGYLLTKGLLYAGPVAGGDWHAVANTAPTVPRCLRGGQLGPWLLAPGSADLFLVCTSPGVLRPAGSLALYRSADRGLTWQDLGPVAESGAPAALAIAPTSGRLVLATSTGIYYSTDQRSWHRAKLAPAPAGGFGFVGMTTTLQGVAVPADPRLGEIFTTVDGGLTWQPSPIP